MNLDIRPQADRCNDLSYEDILNLDTRPVPAYLRQGPVPDIGTDPVPAGNYTDPAFFQQEVDKLWSRCWQMACREEDIPNVGDYVVYDMVGKSYLIVRTAPDTIKALLNVCLHRGRKLATQGGCKSRFRCMFHGFEWNIDGSFKHNPMAWDFPQWEGRDMSLPQAQVARWGGFVFVNFDKDAKPLDDVIHPIPEHFARYDLANMYTALHISKTFPANWKAVAEAFMESHHSITTHPQFMAFLGDANSQYDVFSPYVSRQFSAMGVPSPFVDKSQLSESDIWAAMLRSSGRVREWEQGEGPTVPEGVRARAYAAEQQRHALAAEDGYDYADISDAEMLDPLLYNLWPNLSVWAGFSLNLVYRWRPVDVDTAIMDVRVLKRVPKNGPRPRPAPLQVLGIDDPCAAVEGLGSLGGVFDQDMANLPYVQQGLKAGGRDFPVHFGKYSELRIRQLHRTLADFMAR